MSQATATTAAAVDDSAAERPSDERPRSRGTIRSYWRLAGGYWRGRTARQAWILTLSVAVLVVANIGVHGAPATLHLPLPEGEDYETVGGYINMIYGRIPDIGDTVAAGEAPLP